MSGRLGLRQRIALFFAALALLAVGSVVVGGLVAMREGVPATELIGGGIVAAFGIAVSAALVGLLFDENVARPVDKLAAAMRARAHGGVSEPLDKRAAKHLADLAPAAAAVCDRLAELDSASEKRLASAIAAVEAEKAQLSAILSEIPVAVMAVDQHHRITLYDRQCVHALGGVATLGLGRSVFRYLDEAALRDAVGALAATPSRYADVSLPTADGALKVDARLRLISGTGGYVLSIEVDEDVVAERPLVFDFHLLERTKRGAALDISLSALPFVVFDTETTGLEPARDEIVQVGAVRALNGRLVEGETFDTLVDPGRKIPPGSSRVHGITDDMVAGAPSPLEAVRDFHDFARNETLVAHNAPFDLAFLHRHAKTGGFEFDAPVLDTVLLSAAIFGQSEEHTLDAIADRLGVVIAGAVRHTALGDAVATGRVLVKMIPMLEAAGVVTLGDAIEAMRRHQRMMPTADTLFRKTG